MARLTFLWHLHQPLYRTADGHVHAPWVLLHAAGEYLTLVQALESTGWRGHVLNLSPLLLEQLAAYRDGTARDPLLEALTTPAHDLSPGAQRELLRWAFLLNPAQIRRVPRLEELAARVGRAAGQDPESLFNEAELTDIQVLLVLAYAWPNLAHEESLTELARRGRDFPDSARRVAVAWLAACPGRLLDAYRRLATADGLEISTSPYGHPIVPLLLDTGIVQQSWAPHPAPSVPSFAAPEDAVEQIRLGLDAARSFGFSPAGCWAPEGAVSAEAVALYAAHGVRWLASDEGVLAASLGGPMSGETGLRDELFRPWRLGAAGPSLYFRHHELSGFISFTAARESDERRAARRFATRLKHLARRIPADGGVVIALDGENPWTAYPDGGSRFLATLAGELQQSAALEPATLAQRTATETPATLERLHPGSWIGATFATWIGHPEKNRGWELLDRVRTATRARLSRSALAAEGSDWWWWFGDDNPTLLAPLYDALFRAHLRDACVAAGVTPPPELAAPVRSDSVTLRLPFSREWPEPELDGRTTSYFEWAVATWMDAPAGHRGIARVALRLGERTLWLRVDPRPDAAPPSPLIVTLAGERSRRTLTLPDDLPGSCALERSLEARIPLPDGPVLLCLECQGERLPLEGYWRLEAQLVDEA